MIEDMLSDLQAYGVYDIDRACAAWRQSGEKFFPTSGELIGKIRERIEASVVYARARAVFHSPAIEPERKFPRDLKPWRQILAEHGRPIPANSSALAQSLDLLQK